MRSHWQYLERVSKPPRRISKNAPGQRPPAAKPKPRRTAAPAPLPASAAAPALHDCFAVVAPGLESLALAEAVALELPARLTEGGGGIEWRGDLKSVLRANLGLRIASRVVVRVAQFEAISFAELERQARKVGWGRVIPAGSTVRFRVTCKKSRLYHSDAVAQRIADAIVRALPGTKAQGASGRAGDDDPDASRGEAELGATDQLIIVRIFHDQCTISADTSGDLLHRRGYRQATAKAPMRETIAAALLAASGWDGVAPLVDPLCGSGTIPIEAALMARRIQPGAGRSFSVERWPALTRTMSVRVRAELADAVLPAAPGAIVGSDRDAGAIASAFANAERAGVSADVSLVERAISALVLPPGATGWVVANPPYGVRVGDTDRVRDLWARFGAVLRERGRGWRVALLSPDQALERQLGIPMRVVATTTNGGIPIRLVVGDVP
jgi:putative N6-adenine-specific DNA methylase